jgi:hypothetical protein
MIPARSATFPRSIAKISERDKDGEIATLPGVGPITGSGASVGRSRNRRGTLGALDCKGSNQTNAIGRPSEVHGYPGGILHRVSFLFPSRFNR